MTVNRSAERQRHVRALIYLLVSLSLALLGNFYLGFDRGQTLAYAVTAYIMLNLLNFRAMFVRSTPPNDASQ